MSPPSLVLPRVAAGDPDAPRLCVQRFGGLVWALARRYTRSDADAEDAVQEIFVDLLRSSARFDPARASEAGYVAMIARRRLIDLARRRAVRAAPLDAPDPAPALDPEGHVEATLAARAVAKLPERERQVLLLATYEGLSHQEIATKTGLPLGSVKTYARRALSLVRAMLATTPAGEHAEVEP